MRDQSLPVRVGQKHACARGGSNDACALGCGGNTDAQHTYDNDAPQLPPGGNIPGVRRPKRVAPHREFAHLHRPIHVPVVEPSQLRRRLLKPGPVVRVVSERLRVRKSRTRVERVSKRAGPRTYAGACEAKRACDGECHGKQDADSFGVQFETLRWHLREVCLIHLGHQTRRVLQGRTGPRLHATKRVGRLHQEVPRLFLVPLQLAKVAEHVSED